MRIDALLTGDQTLHFEQNFPGRQIAVVVLSTIKTELIAPAIDRVAQAIQESRPGQVTFVLCGTFDRKKKS